MRRSASYAGVVRRECCGMRAAPGTHLGVAADDDDVGDAGGMAVGCPRWK